MIRHCQGTILIAVSFTGPRTPSLRYAFIVEGLEECNYNTSSQFR